MDTSRQGTGGSGDEVVAAMLPRTIARWRRAGRLYEVIGVSVPPGSVSGDAPPEAEPAGGFPTTP